MSQYQNRPLTANALVIKDKNVVLVKRTNDPFKGSWAIPGGFVDVNESASDCALRELEEETGLKGKILSFVGLYDDPNRDPRHTVCACFLVTVENFDGMKGGSDASEVKLFSLDNLPDLAFDHSQMIHDTLSNTSSS